jgi:FMN-dependent NADH-azoreductase
MVSLLHVDSSANRSDESISRRLTALFADAWRAVHGSAEYQYRDLAATPVPPLDTAYCALGRRVERHGLLPPARVAELIESPAEQREWELTRPLITELLSAGTVLIGAPMYNYSIPASLKAWIDRVSFPGAFHASDTGDSLLRDTKVVVITARGGSYGSGTPREAWDFQTPYLRAYFAKQGVSVVNLSFITAEMTLAGLVPRLADFRSSAASSLATAQAEVTGLASSLAEPARVHATRTQ